MYKTFLVWLGLFVAAAQAAFVSSPAARRTTSFGRCQQHPPLQMMMPQDVLATANNLWVATIDSDIANIPDNEFAPIFAGGVLVMFGGLISAAIVGYIVDKNDLYVDLLAESYMQGGEEDKELWEKLSQDEALMAEALDAQVKAQKEGKPPPDIDALIAQSLKERGLDQQEQTTNGATEAPETETKKQEVDMFSDYN